MNGEMEDWHPPTFTPDQSKGGLVIPGFPLFLVDPDLCIYNGLEKGPQRRRCFARTELLHLHKHAGCLLFFVRYDLRTANCH